MADKSINVFASKEYHLLYWMEQHQIGTSVGALVKFTQAELAQEYGCSPATVNKWLQELRKANCVELYKKKGNYRVTATGHKVIAQMQKIESIIGGTQNGH